MYTSFLRISNALHLGIFHQPSKYTVLRQAPRIGNKPKHQFKQSLKPFSLFFNFGQEPKARLIAKAICQYRENKAIKRSSQLVKIIVASLPRARRRQKRHPATRCFQALRIAVNNELENLSSGLAQARRMLVKSGRLVVVSFHSLEDKIVKDFFRVEAKSDQLLILTKKPIRPSPAEIRGNPTSRSARLRAAQKIV